METIATLFGAVARAVGQVLDLGVMALGGPSGTFCSPQSVALPSSGSLSTAGCGIAVDPRSGRLDLLGQDLPDPMAICDLDDSAIAELNEGLAFADMVTASFE
jgi:hypothetical protein